MRLLFGVILVSACGGGAADELASKSWTMLPDRPGAMSTGYAFDSAGRLLQGTLDHHTYRFDLATRVWSDFGADPSTNGYPFQIQRDGADVPIGHYRAQPMERYFRPSTSDPLTWSMFAEMADSYTVYFGRNGVAWRSDAEMVPATLERFDGTAWTVVQNNVAGPFNMDDAGHIITGLDLGNGMRQIALLDDAGAVSRVLHTCDGVMMTDICEKAPDHFHTRPDGSEIWSTDVRMYRSRPGSTEPTAFGELPVMDGDDPFIHTLNFTYDGAGNAYATRSDNNYGTEALFVLDADADEWKRVIDTPGYVDIVIVRQDGTVFLVDAGKDNTFYILE